jgi:GNAT superfamily N-acetyltransferase
MTLRARPAAPADYDDYARLFPELHTPGAASERARWQAELMPSTIFVERAGQVVGYGHAEALGADGYVRQVVVTPGARGQGVGRAIMSALADSLSARGCTALRLNVKVDNTPAIRLYESLGLRVAHRSSGVRLHWSVLERLPRETPAPEVHTLPPEHDAALEARFELLAGQLADLRARGSWVLLELAGAQGLACFDPAYPGSSPFRVARPTLAVHLLEATRRHARPEHDFTTLFVENAPELEAALVAAGAELSMQVLHMVGESLAQRGSSRS